MSELADALELLHLAHAKAETIRAEIRIRRHIELTQRAWQRWQEGLAGRAETISSTPASSDSSEVFAEDGFRVWTQRPGWLWRIERTAGTGSRLTVLNGTRYWIDFGPGHDVFTNASDPDPREGRDPEQLVADLFDPSAPLTLFQLRHVGKAELIERACHRLAGLPKHRGEADDYRRSWYYADRHELWVDAEFGTVLRYEAYLDGMLMATSEVLSIAFNEPLDPSRFAGP